MPILNDAAIRIVLDRINVVNKRIAIIDAYSRVLTLIEDMIS
jgi:hypothetical protein